VLLLDGMVPETGTAAKIFTTIRDGESSLMHRMN